MAATTRQDVGLALGEALTNAARHAYPSDQPGEVRVDAATDGEHLSIRVTDRGAGATGRRPGLGMQLMRGVAEHVEIGPTFDGQGTVVVMEFPMRDRTPI